MKHIQVTEPVSATLRASTVTANTLTLPGQLDRPAYVAVMKVIEAAGGKWDKRAKCHTFTTDPRETFKEALGNGKIADRSEKAVRTEKQAFYTPAAVADIMIEHACIQPGHKVLEPSAGNGALIRAIPKHLTHVEVVAIESDEKGCWGALTDSDLALRVRAIFADFLTSDPSQEKFDRVLMNPPFTKGQDVDHVTHARKFLKPDGWLLAIMSPSFEHHSGKKFEVFRQLMAERGEVLERFSNGEFKESGTAINTVLVKLRA